MKLGDIIQIHRSFLSDLINSFCDDRETKQGMFHCESEGTSLVFKTVSAVPASCSLSVRTICYSEVKRVQETSNISQLCACVWEDTCSCPAPSVYPRTMSPCRVYSIALDFLWLSHRERVVELWQATETWAEITRRGNWETAPSAGGRDPVCVTPGGQW
jgi:hypothetical protein